MNSRQVTRTFVERENACPVCSLIAVGGHMRSSRLEGYEGEFLFKNSKKPGRTNLRKSISDKRLKQTGAVKVN